MPLYSAGLWLAVNIAAGRLEAAGGVVDEVGRGQAEVDDVEALRRDAVGERGGELDAGRPHVARHEDARRALVLGGEAREGGADAPAHRSASSWSGAMPRMS